MKKQDALLGLLVSAGISVLAVLPRLIKMGSPHYGNVLAGFLYFFLICYSFWWIFSLHFNSTKKWISYNKSFLPGAAFIIISAALSVLVDQVYSFLFGSETQFPEISGTKSIYVMWVRGFVLAGLFYFIQYYIFILKEKQKSELELERMMKTRLEANVQSLREQLSPHFLFNTLNTLSTLTKEKHVKDFISRLASIYRYLLRYKDSDLANLHEEISFLESYLYIVKTRMEGAFDCRVDIDPDKLMSKIPPLTLQMLTENAIKHNVASLARPLKMEIYNTDTRIIVRNQLQEKRTVSEGEGIGLQNIIQRYRLLFGQEVEIEKSNEFFTVKLPLV